MNISENDRLTIEQFLEPQEHKVWRRHYYLNEKCTCRNCRYLPEYALPIAESLIDSFLYSRGKKDDSLQTRLKLIKKNRLKLDNYQVATTFKHTISGVASGIVFVALTISALACYFNTSLFAGLAASSATILVASFGLAIIILAISAFAFLASHMIFQAVEQHRKTKAKPLRDRLYQEE